MQSDTHLPSGILPSFFWILTTLLLFPCLSIAMIADLPLIPVTAASLRLPRYSMVGILESLSVLKSKPAKRLGKSFLASSSGGAWPALRRSNAWYGRESGLACREPANALLVSALAENGDSESDGWLHRRRIVPRKTGTCSGRFC